MSKARLHGRRRAAALHDHLDRLDLVGERAGHRVHGLAGPAVGGDREPMLVGVADPDPAGAAGPGHIGAQQPDRPGTGDQHPVTGPDPDLVRRPDRDRQRLDQRGGLVGQLIRHGVGPDGVEHDVLGERPVHRRGGEEPDLRAQVVSPGQALPAPAAGLLRLQRDPLTRRTVGHLGADRADGSRRLMAEHQWLADHEVGDPAVVEVVHVRATDPDRGHLDQHLERAGLGHRGWAYGDLVRLGQQGLGLLTRKGGGHSLRLGRRPRIPRGPPAGPG